MSRAWATAKAQKSHEIHKIVCIEHGENGFGICFGKGFGSRRTLAATFHLDGCQRAAALLYKVYLLLVVGAPEVEVEPNRWLWFRFRRSLTK